MDDNRTRLINFIDLPGLARAGKAGKVYDHLANGERGDFVGTLTKFPYPKFIYSRTCAGILGLEVNPFNPEFGPPGLMGWWDTVEFEEADQPLEGD